MVVIAWRTRSRNFCDGGFSCGLWRPRRSLAEDISLFILVFTAFQLACGRN